MGFLDLLQQRGYLYQCSDLHSLAKEIESGSIAAYIGFDCTAPSLHLGSLVQIMILRAMQSFGIKPIVLFGGGTTRIGDPSGKTETRKMLDDAAITANMQGIKKVVAKFIDPNKALFVDNAEWLNELCYIDFLRDFGRFFSVNHMLSYESIKNRLSREQHLSFIEFNYMLLQAYDFCELYARYGCKLQVGGSDQWGNITAGIDVARRYKGVELYGLTTPLITTISGEKMGKTAVGAIWLDGDPYDYWQYFRNIDDRDIEKMLLLFTDISLNEIAELIKLHGSDINTAKKVLATAATSIAFGQEAADRVSDACIKEFEHGESSGLPLLEINVSGDLNILQLVKMAGLASSSTEAKQLIRSGGVRINDVPKDDVNEVISEREFTLKSGKRRYIVRVVV